MSAFAFPWLQWKSIRRSAPLAVVVVVAVVVSRCCRLILVLVLRRRRCCRRIVVPVRSALGVWALSGSEVSCLCLSLARSLG